MQKRVSEIADELLAKGLLESWHGPDNTITGIPDIAECGANDLAFVERNEFVEAAIARKPGAVVTDKELAGEFAELTGTAILVLRNVRLAQAILRQAYTDRNLRDTGWAQVHDSAIIHPSATIAADVLLGPGAVIERDVNIGAGCVIMANCVIQDGSQIGRDTVIYPGVVIGYECQIGERCIIKAGASIGMEGFGFAQDENHKSYRIPQLGNVVIGDDVVVGSNCTFDRGAFGPTRIGDGCKFDTHVHVAHGVEIGKDCLFVSQVGIAGTSKIGDRVIIAGQGGVIDHITICDDVVLTQRPGVISDIKEPGVYAGHPAQPVKQFFKNSIAATHLAEMKRSIAELEKKLAKLDPESEK